ncbi:MAG: tRNA lysidine(34) synthetase TilS [Clostridia bacterium]|nr:tRNA lysidine(34) synthetase TilS [Clostridia bacterium]MDD4386250.1 tRNA lysidine(34) synthetase TilS [Clostridia bacterium]
MKNILTTNNNLLERVKNYILKSKCINDKDKIVIAVSGGPDSMALIDILYKLKCELSKKYNIDYVVIVAHVNHMLREESEDEKVYVENYCNDRNIVFYYLKKDVKNESIQHKMGIEEYARKIRYDFFEKVVNETGSNKIAIAHNLNDNVETILLNIIRGSGIKGLCGMNYIYGKIIRPLINISKKDLLDYCNYNELKPCFDKTNEQDIYIRNKIRLNLIPTIEREYNSNFVNNILRLRDLAILDEEFLNSYTTQIVDKAIQKKDEDCIIFDFEDILKQSESIKQRSIREIIFRKLNNVEGMENIHIIDILKLLERNIPKKKYIIGNKFCIELIQRNIARIYCNK